MFQGLFRIGLGLVQLFEWLVLDLCRVGLGLDWGFFRRGLDLQYVGGWFLFQLGLVQGLFRFGLRFILVGQDLFRAGLGFIQSKFQIFGLFTGFLRVVFIILLVLGLLRVGLGFTWGMFQIFVFLGQGCFNFFGGWFGVY